MRTMATFRGVLNSFLWLFIVSSCTIWIFSEVMAQKQDLKRRREVIEIVNTKNKISTHRNIELMRNNNAEIKQKHKIIPTLTKKKQMSHSKIRIKNPNQFPDQAEQIQSVIHNVQNENSDPKAKCLSALYGRDCAASKVTDPRTIDRDFSGRVCFSFEQKFIVVRKDKQCDESGYWFFDPANCIRPKFIALMWSIRDLDRELKKMGFVRIWWKPIQSGSIPANPLKFRIREQIEISQTKKISKMHLFARRDCERKEKTWGCVRNLAWSHLKETFKEDKMGIPRPLNECQLNHAIDIMAKKLRRNLNKRK